MDAIFKAGHLFPLGTCLQNKNWMFCIASQSKLYLNDWNSWFWFASQWSQFFTDFLWKSGRWLECSPSWIKSSFFFTSFQISPEKFSYCNMNQICFTLLSNIQIFFSFPWQMVLLSFSIRTNLKFIFFFHVISLWNECPPSLPNTIQYKALYCKVKDFSSIVELQ